MKERPYIKLIIGGLTLSIIIFLFPSLYGEGYSSLNILLNGRTEADWNQVMNGSLFAGSDNAVVLVVYIGLVMLTRLSLPLRPTVPEVAAVLSRPPCLSAALPVSSSHVSGT